MKQCPLCNRTYSDASLNYCLQDGTALIAAFDPEATHRRSSEPTILSEKPVVPFPPSPPALLKERRRGPWILVFLIGGLLFLVCAVVATALLVPKLTELAISTPSPSPVLSPEPSLREKSPPNAGNAGPTPTRSTFPTPLPTPTGPVLANPTPAPTPPKVDETPTYSAPGRYPEGSIRYLTDGELGGRSCTDLKIMRNEVFARHGYIFNTPEMRSYFLKQSWYSPQSSDVTRQLSAVEAQNIQTIKDHEAMTGCR